MNEILALLQTVNQSVLDTTTQKRLATVILGSTAGFTLNFD